MKFKKSRKSEKVGNQKKNRKQEIRKNRKSKKIGNQKNQEM